MSIIILIKALIRDSMLLKRMSRIVPKKITLLRIRQIRINKPVLIKSKPHKSSRTGKKILTIR